MNIYVKFVELKSNESESFVDSSIAFPIIIFQQCVTDIDKLPIANGLIEICVLVVVIVGRFECNELNLNGFYASIGLFHPLLLVCYGKHFFISKILQVAMTLLLINLNLYLFFILLGRMSYFLEYAFMLSFCISS